jgi:hypothetical protein
MNSKKLKDRDWICSECGKKNFYWRTSCGKCDAKSESTKMKESIKGPSQIVLGIKILVWFYGFMLCFALASILIVEFNLNTEDENSADEIEYDSNVNSGANMDSSRIKGAFYILIIANPLVHWYALSKILDGCKTIIESRTEI